MKFILTIILSCCFFNSYAQKDITLNWVVPQHKQDESVMVNSKSLAIGSYFYSEYHIEPAAAKTLHLRIYARVASVAHNLFNTTYAPFILQAITRKEKLFEETYQSGQAIINIPLKNTDTVALFFISNPPANDGTDFAFEYTIGDTAELNYNNKKPQEVFEKMLELACTGYINQPEKLIYPNGLFATGTAERRKTHNRYTGTVTQYTGEKLSRETADRNTADWNKKIVTWLKDYNVTDIKKNTTGDVKLNTDEAETVYTKKNAQGVTLFIVTVFKETVGEGSEAEPMSYTTGVRITN